MEDLNPFKLWLENHHYQSSTIRNYLVDIRKFVESTDLPFKNESYINYLSTVKSDPNYSRYLSSLKKFVAYALDQGLISTNPLKITASYKSTPTITDLVFQYKTHLEKHHTPTSTVRNYLNDLVQYVTWLDNQPVES